MGILADGRFKIEVTGAQGGITAGAQAALTQAEEAAAVAQAVSGPSYASTAAGLAATSDGEAFAVNDDGIVTVYLNDGGTAVEQRDVATAQYIEDNYTSKNDLASELGAGSVGVSHDSPSVPGTLLDRFKREVFITDAPFNAVGDAVAGRTGVATASDATFTDANASWTADDIGKTIIIGEGGAANVKHVTTIASINSATSIELTLAPASSLASCRYAYGTPSDDAFKDALAYVNMIGGGVIRVPVGNTTGNYLLMSTIRIGSKTQFLCDDGVSLFKGHENTYVTNGLGYDPSSVIPPYAGHSDIVISGGTWDGFACGIFDGYTGFALGYGRNIIIRDTVVLDSIGSGHSVDMATCDNVLFDNVRFYGFALNGNDPSTSDILQLDACLEGSFPYFGVPVFFQCKNIKALNCYFGPNPDNTDPRFGNIQVGIGSHAAVQGEYATKVIVDGCEFVQPEYAGVRVWKWRDVSVLNSRFTGATGRGVHITATPAGSESSKNVARVQTNQAEASDGILIDNCDFSDFTGLPVFVAGIGYGTDITIKHEGVKIANCKWKNITGDCIDARDVRNFFLTGSNSYKNVGRVIVTGTTGGDCENVVIEGGGGQGFSNTVGAITLFKAVGFSVTGGVYRNMQGRTILSETSSGGVISNVTQIDICLGTVLAGIAVQNVCNNVTISGCNTVKINTTTTAPDIFASGSCVNVDIIDPVSNSGNAPVQHTAAGGIAKFRYAGTPETFITARIGSECNDVTNGVKYMKKSGTAATGWKLVTQAV